MLRHATARKAFVVVDSNSFNASKVPAVLFVGERWDVHPPEHFSATKRAQICVVVGSFDGGTMDQAILGACTWAEFGAPVILGHIPRENEKIGDLQESIALLSVTNRAEGCPCMHRFTHVISTACKSPREMLSDDVVQGLIAGFAASHQLSRAYGTSLMDFDGRKGMKPHHEKAEGVLGAHRHDGARKRLRVR